ncbi:hypothetical protein [Tenacibaculum amylolyticum]|uniref:hypothetical protein n=1 Tax=Tenacibaculum amylolyticum TaxID=104269 RepID=UPI003895C508
MIWSKRNKTFLFVVVLAIGTMYGAYQYIFQPPKTITNSTIDFNGSASSLLSEVTQNPTQWQNKIVSITGKITSVDSQGFILEENIFCQVDTTINIKNIQQNQTITTKGFVIGFDDLLNELKLNQCIILTN